MARKPRVEFAETLYHVIVRGNQRQKIFYDDKDRLSDLQRLEYYRERYGFTLCAYVLMPNHVLCGAPHKTCYVKLSAFHF